MRRRHPPTVRPPPEFTIDRTAAPGRHRLLAVFRGLDRVPPFAKEAGWTPFTSRTDCIVVGRRHLARSAAITVYLDILHELYHIFQRREGRELWDIAHGYAGSPTEIEAYRFVAAEARRLGASEAYLREYLRVEWIDAREYARLVRNVGVAPRGNVPPR